MCVCVRGEGGWTPKGIVPWGLLSRFWLRWSQFMVFSQVKSLQEERQGLQKEVRCVIIKAPKLLASVPSHNWLNSRKIHNDKAWAKDYAEGWRVWISIMLLVSPLTALILNSIALPATLPLSTTALCQPDQTTYLFLEKTHLLLSISRLLFPPYMKKVESRRVLQITWLLVQMWSEILHHVWKSRDFKVILLILWYCVKVN